jgi:hypothetical protein
MKASFIFSKPVFPFSIASLIRLSFSRLDNLSIKITPAAFIKARSLGKKIALDIRQGRTYPLQNILSRLLINLLIKPNFKKVIHKNKQTGMKAVYENLRLRALI